MPGINRRDIFKALTGAGLVALGAGPAPPLALAAPAMDEILQAPEVHQEIAADGLAGKAFPLSETAEERLVIGTLLAAEILPGTAAATAMMGFLLFGDELPAEFEWARKRCTEVVLYMSFRFAGVMSADGVLIGQ